MAFDPNRKKFEAVTITVPCEINFPVFTDRQRSAKGATKYSCQISVVKGSPEHEILRGAIQACIKMNGLEDEIKRRVGFRIPLKEGKATYSEGKIVASASSKKPVGVVDQERHLLKDEQIEAIWGGSKVNVRIAVLPYDIQGNAGIAFYLQAVQLIENKHGSARDISTYFDRIIPQKNCLVPPTEEPISF